jgi:hypothetical protein
MIRDIETRHPLAGAVIVCIAGAAFYAVMWLCGL